MNILLTCAGRRNYIVDYFKAALEQTGGNVYAANSNSYAAAFVPAEQSFLVPEIHHPDYIKTILQICTEYGISAIIPLFDIELPVLAEARNMFLSHGIQVIVSSPDVIKICYDKWETFKFLQQNGFQSPRTYIDLDSVNNAIDKKEIDFPLIIKPRWGMGSIGIMEIDNREELIVLYHKIEKVIQESYLGYQSSKEPGQMILIQEKLTGQEYGLDVVNNLRGEYVTTFVKRKIAMRSGETDIAVTENDLELMDFGAKLAKKINHIANLDVDLFRTDKNCFVLEMNPRFGGGYPFSHLAGANLPAAIIAWLKNEKADPAWFTITPDITGFKGIVPLKMTKSPIDFT
jgi:carbamoyl-phosphate synthase large subunit